MSATSSLHSCMLSKKSAWSASVAEQHSSTLCTSMVHARSSNHTEIGSSSSANTSTSCLNSCIASKCASHSVGTCGVDADGIDEICNAHVSTADPGNAEALADNTVGVCVTPVAAGSSCTSGYGRPNCPSSTHHKSDQAAIIGQSVSFARISTC